MAEKKLNTRIILKHDSLENWLKDEAVVLKAGEVGIATVETTTKDEKGNIIHVPTALLKVGDGTTPFKSLNWVSAPAADVYDWAKQTGLTITKNGEGNVVSGIEWDATANDGKGGIKFTTTSVALAADFEQAQADIDAIEKDIADNRAAWEKDDNTTYTFAKTEDGKGITITPSEGEAIAPITFAFLTREEIEALNYLVAADITTGTENGTIAVEGVDVAVKGLQDAAYATVESLNATAKGYADAVEAKIPTDNKDLINGAGYLVAADIENKADKATTLAGYGIGDAYTKAEVDGKFDALDDSQTTVAGGTGITVTDGAAEGSNDHAYTVELDVAGTKTALGLGSAAYTDADAYATNAENGAKEAAAAAQQAIDDYTEAHKDDYTNTQIDEAIKAVQDDVDAIHIPEYNLVKDSTSDYAATYHLTKDGVNLGAAINIPKDMVVEKGEVKALEAGVWGEAGTYIVLTLANATDDKLYIPVDSLIEYVTSGSADTDAVVIHIDENHKVTATLTDGAILAKHLSAEAKALFDEAGAAAAVQGNLDALANGQVKTNSEAIAAINNPDTGILAQAKEDAKSKADAAEAAAKEYADGLIEGLADIATSGNVNDLVQTAGDVLVFDCGTSTTVI